MTSYLAPSITVDMSGVKCREQVLMLSTMTWTELEAHLESTARASSTAFVLQPRRPKPEKPKGGKRRWAWR